MIVRCNMTNLREGVKNRATVILRISNVSSESLDRDKGRELRQASRVQSWIRSNRSWLLAKMCLPFSCHKVRLK
jgi:hypothetical protein